MMIEDRPLISIDYKKLGQYLLRVIAGIGIINVWILLAVASIAALIFAFNWASSIEGFSYALWLLFIPIGIICWWVCYMLSIEFLTETGIELNGSARYIIIPIALPMAAFSFLFSLWASAGETLKSRVTLYLSFLLGLALIIVTVVRMF